jgi:RNA polymerase sigma-70 factor (ECF subfamily)
MESIRNTTDKDLIKGVIEGNKNSFNDLYTLYRPLLMAFVFRYIKNREDSEEIVQDVFTRIWEQKEKIDINLSFKSFLFTITKNKIMDYFRKAKMESLFFQYITNYLETIHDTTNIAINNKEIDNTITAAVKQLPEKRKMVFILSKKFNLTRSEIATFLNISENTVKNQLLEAIQFLRENLKNEVIMLLLLITNQFK